MKNIVLITDSLYAWWSNKVCSELENLFFIEGYKTLTISLDVKDNNIYKILGKIENVWWFWNKPFPFRSYLIIIKNIYKTIQILKKNTPNVIISHSSRSNLINLITKYFISSKRILVHHEDTKNFIQSQSFFNWLSINIINKWVFFLKSKNEIFVTVSEITKKWLKEIFEIEGNILVIHNWVNFENIKKLSKEKIDIDFPFIINVWTLCGIKNQELLIKSFHKIHTLVKEHLLLVWDWPDLKNLKTLVNNLWIRDKVHFIWFQSNPYKFISKSSLFVFTSKTESFWLVLLESMYLWIPCITTKNWGVLEIIWKSKWALILENFDEDSLSKYIIDMINNKKMAQFYIENWYKRALDFWIDKQFYKYLKII